MEENHMFHTTPLGIVQLRTASGGIPLTVSLVTGMRQTTTATIAQAQTLGRPAYLAITVDCAIHGHVIDLGVRAERVNVAGLPTTIEELAATEPVVGLIAEYGERLAHLTVHLAMQGLATRERVAVAFTVHDLEFLRHCLRLTEHRWREAIDDAETAARQPQRDDPPPPGFMNIEPTPWGYRAAARLFGSELERVEQLGARLARLIDLARAAAGVEGEPQ
jgi:hypothetical protein